MKNRRSFLWIVLLAAGFYLLAAPRFYVGFFSDDARDILAARSLLHGAYADLQTPGHPPLNFPLPGFPLLLAPFVALFRSWLAGLRLVPIGFTLASLFLLDQMAQKIILDRPLRYATVALFAFNPATIAFSTLVIADAAYICFVLAAFNALLAALKFPSTQSAWLPGVLVAAAALLRPEGVVLWIAVMSAVLYAKGWKMLLPAALPALAAGLVLLWRNLQVTGSATAYSTLWLEAAFSLSRGPAVLLRHAAVLAQKFFLELLLGLSFTDFSRFTWLVGGLASLVLLAGLLRGFILLTKERRVPEAWSFAFILYAYGHMLLHLAWPAADTHYLWPLLPLALILLVPAAGRWFIPPIVLLYLWQAGFAIYETVHPPREHQAPVGTYVWIREKTPAGSYFLAPNAPALTLYSGRFSKAMMMGKNADDWRYELLAKGIHYVLVAPAHFLSISDRPDRSPDAAWQAASQIVQEETTVYKPVYRNVDENVSIYELAPDLAFVKAYQQYRSVTLPAPGAAQEAWEQQLRELDRIIQIYPFPQVLNAYGVAAILSGKHFQKARQRLSEAVRLRPSFAFAWVNLARVEFRMERRWQACRSYRRAMDCLSADPAQAYLIPLVRQEEEQHSCADSIEQNHPGPAPS